MSQWFIPTALLLLLPHWNDHRTLLVTDLPVNLTRIRNTPGNPNYLFYLRSLVRGNWLTGFCSRFFVLFWMKYLGERSGSWCNISLEHDSVTRFRVLILMCGIVTGHVSQTLTLQANSNPEPFPPIMLRKQEVRWYDAWQHIWNVLNHTTTVVNNSAVALWSQNTQADSKCIYFTLCVWVCLSQAPRCVCQIL